MDHNNTAAVDNMVVNNMTGDTVVVDMAVVPSRHFEHNISHFPIQLFASPIPPMQPNIVVVVVDTETEQYQYG